MQNSSFLCGIVEGFYGRQWRWSDRQSYVAFLAELNLNSYLYCPKGDASLRRHWHKQWPQQDLRELTALAQSCRDNRINWGVGLSPYALHSHYGDSGRKRLERRVRQINDLGGALFALLFDDMPGDFEQLAARQAEIVGDVCHWSNAERIIVCPTYYSFDPQLEKFFGSRPAGYWRDLGAMLPENIDIFWTGNDVCSQEIHKQDVLDISALLGRPPVLWDNYPVNDGARTSDFLHLRPLGHRDPDMRSELRGHLCNPMNQAALSRGPLSGLGNLYTPKAADWRQFYPHEVARQLQTDGALFQETGLMGLTAKQRRSLIRTYSKWDDSAAREVVQWLEGKYAFDPACLTD